MKPAVIIEYGTGRELAKATDMDLAPRLLIAPI